MSVTGNAISFTPRARISLFLLSAATLIFEINLSRLFSVTQFYHFAFMIVSLALLGFGASGTFLAIYPGLSHRRTDHTIGALALGTGLSMLGAYVLTNRLPFDSFSIAWDRRQVTILTLHYLALAMPFFFSGLAVGMLFDAFPHLTGNVYATNLTGSALGCVLALAAPVVVGGEGTIIFSSGLAGLAGLIAVFPHGGQSSDRDVFPLAATLLLIFTNWALGVQLFTGSPLPVFELDISPYKSLSYALQYPDADLVSQRWNAFSRVDVVQSDLIRSLPGSSFRYTQAPPPELGVYVDGDNLSPVVYPDEDLDFSDWLLAALAYQLRPGANTLLLEPRGGLDILTALGQGAGQVTAVEANPLIVEAAAHIYNQPRVKTVIESDRSYLSRSQEQYDIVIFSLASNYHPVRSGAYSLAEDYRYTLEAFKDALDRLDDDGILVITRWLQSPPSEWLRTFALAVTALEDRDLNASGNIAAIRSFNIGLLLVKQTAFTDEELEAVRVFAAERAFDLVYLPDIQAEETNRYSVLEEPIYYQAFSGFLDAPSRQEWLDEYPYEVSPPTDDHPFFGHFFKWSQAPQVISELGKSWQPFGGAGYFVVLVLLALAVLAAVAIILLPLVFAHRKRAPKRVTAGNFIYFGLLGLAYLLVEIPIVQRYMLYLGQPSFAFTAALFSILLFSGIGSRFSHRFSQRGALAVLVAAALATPWMLSLVFDWSLGYPLAVRLVISVVSLAPLGFLMGVPFPAGIRALEAAAPQLIPWAWGVNGAMSVIASILAALLALTFSFTWTGYGSRCGWGSAGSESRIRQRSTSGGLRRRRNSGLARTPPRWKTSPRMTNSILAGGRPHAISCPGSA